MLKDAFWEILTLLCLLPYVLISVYLVWELPIEISFLCLSILALLQLGLAIWSTHRIQRQGDSSLVLIIWVSCEYLFLTCLGLTGSLILWKNPSTQAMTFLIIFLMYNVVFMTYMIHFIIQMRRWDSPVSKTMRRRLISQVVNYFPSNLSRPAAGHERFFCDLCGMEAQPVDLTKVQHVEKGEIYICPTCRSTRQAASNIIEIDASTPKQSPYSSQSSS